MEISQVQFFADYTNVVDSVFNRCQSTDIRTAGVIDWLKYASNVFDFYPLVNLSTRCNSSDNIQGSILDLIFANRPLPLESLRLIAQNFNIIILAITDSCTRQ